MAGAEQKDSLGPEYLPLKVLPPKTFETERLILRASALADARLMFDLYARDPVATKYMSFPCTGRIEDTEDFVRSASQYFDGRGSPIRQYSWMIFKRDGNLPVGSCGFGPENDTTLSGGYILAQRFWEQGIASEAFKAILDWAKIQPLVRRIEASVHPDNIASGKVLQKAGLTSEGLFPRTYVFPNISAEPCDALKYAWTRA